MNKIYFSSSFVARTPAFSFLAQLPAHEKEIKALIAESSNAFFELVKDLDFSNLEGQDPKLLFTLWKYFNRAKYRSTPFGNFSAISLLPMRLSEHSTKTIAIRKEMQGKSFIDWSHHKINLSLPKPKRFQANSCVYSLGEEMRFAKLVDQYFQLSSVSSHPVLSDVLSVARKGCSLEALLQVLESHAITGEEGLEFIQEMLDMQLLLSEQSMNAVGTDYFQRIGIKEMEGKLLYTIATREAGANEFNKQPFEDLLELVNFLSATLPVGENKALNVFKTKFLQKYEYRFIPLLEALDPEHGVGYDSLEQSFQEDSLVEKLKNQLQTPEASAPVVDWNDLNQFLLKEWMNGETIRLEKFTGWEKRRKSELPNTFSALGELLDDSFWLRSMGGVSGTALLGRFSLADDNIQSFAQEIAAHEVAMNPGVLFFDIDYQGDERVGNVNRRASIYPFVLPILCWSESKEPIDLNEVLVSVVRNEIVLYSTRYNQRMVPRLASAYNYVRSDFSVFRFLADLQSQGLQVNLNLDLARTFPGMLQYPRVVFKKVVVSPASWKLDKAFNNVEEAEAWLEQKGISSCFKIRQSDQFLFFRREVEEDVWAFYMHVKSQSGIFYLEEAALPEEPLFKDEKERGYSGELQVLLQHDKQVYSALSIDSFSHEPVEIKKSFLPGEEWFYYELYCEEFRSNAILLELFHGFLEGNANSLSQWFFIRYTDPSPHLRFRFSIKENVDYKDILTGLNELFSFLVDNKIIKEVLLKTYEPEYHRYGAFGMQKVESFFQLDSTLVLLSIEQWEEQVHPHYRFSHFLFRQILTEQFPDLSQQIAFVKQLTKAFQGEFKMTPFHFKQINAEYRDFSQDASLEITLQMQDFVERWNAEFCSLLKQNGSPQQEKLISDLFHMHVNRLFPSNQRLHESIIYEFLLKDLQRERKRQ